MAVFIHTNYITVSFPLKRNIPFRIESITGTYIVFAASVKEFINKIITEIKNKKGIAADFNDKNYVSNNAAYDMQFRYAGTNITEEKIKEGFIPDLYLYSDGTVMAAKYDSKSDLIAVKVSLDKETINYINEYYDTHLKK